MDNRKKNILLGTLIVGVISMTVAFAALSTNLSINGTAGIPTTRWDIHFANGTDNTSGTHANGKVNKGKIEDVNFQATSITGFTVTLYQPNDEVVYNFDIVNAGTIDAELDNFQRSITCASGSELCDEVMTYTIECEDEQHNNALAQGYILEKNKSVSCEMNVKFNDVDNLSKSKSSKVQASVVNGVYTQGALNATIRADWLWVQKSATATPSGGGQGGSGGNTPSNPYVTTFNGNYTAYRWLDVTKEGYGIASYNSEYATDSYGDNECPSGYIYNNGTCYDENYITCEENLTYDSDSRSCINGDGWNTTLNPNSTAYMRSDGTKLEVCGVFGSGQSGTVCLTSPYYNSNYSLVGDYRADFEDVTTGGTNITTTEGLQATGLKGYALAKTEEMLTKGASYCRVDRYSLICTMTDSIFCYSDNYCTNGGYCYINELGQVYCKGEYGGNAVQVSYDGTTSEL